MTRGCVRRLPLPILALLGSLLLAAGARAGELEVTALDGWTAVEGAVVVVKDADGKEVARGTTARDGNSPPRIEFKDLPAGTYSVEVTYQDGSTKKVGKAEDLEVTADGETKQTVHVEEEGAAAGLVLPTATQAALIGHDVFHGGIEGNSSALATTGYAVASDDPTHCRHGDGNGTPISSDLQIPSRILDDGGEKGGGGGRDLGIPGVLLGGAKQPREGAGIVVNDRDTDLGGSESAPGPAPGTARQPDAPTTDEEPELPAFYSQVKMKCTDGGTGEVLASRRMKLLAPDLLQPRLALEDQLKRDVDAGADPLQCTTDRKGECTIRDVPVTTPAAKQPVDLDVTSAQVVSFNAPVDEKQLGTFNPAFVALFTDQIRIGRQTFYVSLSGGPGDADQIRKAARGHGLALQENLCRKEKPGPPVESLGAFQAPPSSALPSVRLRLQALEGAR